MRFWVGILVIGSAASVQAQSNALPPDRQVSGGPLTTPGVTWSGKLDTLPPWCYTPAKVASKPKAVRRVAARPRAAADVPVKRVTPVRKPAPKPAVQALSTQPRMLCPQYAVGPRMYGTLAPLGSESAIPLVPSPDAAPVDPMTFVEAGDAPGPIAVAEEGGSRFPLGWLAGGGGLIGAGFFSTFVGGDDGNGGNPPGPKPPNPGPPIDPPGPPIVPPVTATPEPATLLLMGTGLAALGGYVRRRKGRDREE